MNIEERERERKIIFLEIILFKKKIYMINKIF